MDEYMSIREDGDYRQQQELEEERQQKIVRALDRVASGVSSVRDARLLASEIGISWKPKTKIEPKKKGNGLKKHLDDVTTGEWFILRRTGSIYQLRKRGTLRHICRSWVQPVKDVTLGGEEFVIVIDRPNLPQ